jgi:hypothetical protein
MDIGIDTTSVLLYFMVLPLLLPLIIGLIVIFVFWKDELGRMAGFFIFKPVIAYPVWLWGPFARLNQETTHIKALDSMLLLLPGLVLTVIIVYPLRHLFYQHRLAWLFLIGDILRWGNTWFITSSGLEIFDIKQSVLGILFWGGLIYPSVYSIITLVILLVRRRLLTKSMLVNEFVTK